MYCFFASKRNNSECYKNSTTFFYFGWLVIKVCISVLIKYAMRQFLVLIFAFCLDVVETWFVGFSPSFIPFMPHYRPYKIRFTLTSLSLFPFHISPAVTRISTLRKKCSYSDLFWSAFFRIRTEYREIIRISPYSVQIRENADQNNSEYGHFLHSAKEMVSSNKYPT